MSLLSGKKPTYLGHKNGRLAVCPKSPNCVSSQTTGKAAIKPISFKGEAASAWMGQTPSEAPEADCERVLSRR